MRFPGNLLTTEGGAPRPGRLVPAFTGVCGLMNRAGTLWIFGLMFLVCADIAARNLFAAPIRGVAEIVGYSIVGTVYLQLANTLHAGRFTRAELLLDWLDSRRPLAGSAFRACFDLTGAVVFAVVTAGVWPGFVEAWREDEVAGVPGDFSFIIWPFKLLVVVGAAATAVEFAIQFLRDLAAGAKAAREPAAGAGRGWPWLLALCALALAAYLMSAVELSNVQIGALSILCMLVLIYAGMPIGLALMVLGFAGIWLMKGNTIVAERTLALAASEYLRNYFFGVVPLFVLMGLLVSASDMGRETFDVARWLLRKVRGGLGIATVAANAVFAAITGSSIASAAVFTRVATPEMLSHGYTPRFSVGVVAGSSVLGMLIPPSLLLIVYGFLAEQSVGILFIAAIIPGLILAVAFALLILGMAAWRPHWIGNPAGAADDDDASQSVLGAALKLCPVVALVVLVIGGIYGGLLTPTEAGAAGALGALVIGAVRRRLDLKTLWGVLVETGHITVSILFLILAANVYARMLALSGLPQQTGEFIGSTGLGFAGFIVLYVILLILLGMILDSISIMLIILPLALPVLLEFGGDPVWFGIVTVIAVEIGLLTPPLGITCYVVKSTLGDERITLNQIFLGAAPFALVMLVVTALLILVPELSLVFT